MTQAATDLPESNRSERIAAQRRALPDAPGVYLFRDSRRRVLYVGKAKSLKKRVASHYSSPSTKGAHGMLDEIEHIEFIATQTEAEALLAEQNFIRQYRPRYNVRLRDDKSYPYIAISLDEDFPRVYFTREKHRRGRAYFGPFSNAKRVRETLDLLGKVFQVRDGVLADRQSFYLDNQAARDESEVAEEFVLQYYATSPAIPPQVIVGHDVAGSTGPAIAEALEDRRGAPVEVRHAERGDKRRIYELALRNARLALDQDRLRSEHRRVQRIESLEALQRILAMETIPMRIECFDISNLGAEHTVASMVVFEGAAPKKSDYRRFGIREAVQDDFAAMNEVLSRRMAQYVAQRERSPHEKDYDASFASLPGLIVIDGGKGQLSAGLRALEPFRDLGVTVISLAKRIEEIFLPGRGDPIVLGRDTPALQLLQRARDEAHRFAIEFHRGRRDKAMTRSVLDELPGVGPARKRQLLKHFGTPERFLQATREELEAVPGVPGKVARDIYENVNKIR